MPLKCGNEFSFKNFLIELAERVRSAGTAARFAELSLQDVRNYAARDRGVSFHGGKEISPRRAAVDFFE
jgi:hypothetical protein